MVYEEIFNFTISTNLLGIKTQKKNGTVKSCETREVAYACSYTSGHLVPTLELGINISVYTVGTFQCVPDNYCGLTMHHMQA